MTASYRQATEGWEKNSYLSKSVDANTGDAISPITSATSPEALVAGKVESPSS